MTTLTLEQLNGLAKFLGFNEIAFVSKRFAPSHRYLIDKDGTLEGEAQWNDADLMLALLERAAELGLNPSLSFWPNTKCWAAGEVGRRQAASTPYEAVILAVLQLPEAQP